jgi:hypothetical protein
MWQSIPIVGKIIGGFFDLVGEAVEDKDERNRIKAELTKVLENADLTKFTTLVQAQTAVLVAEVQGQSWLQRNWRPILMLVIVAIVGNNYILYPYLSMFTSKAVVLDLPEKLYNLMTVGVGGYIVGRSTEKSLEIWKGKKSE